MKLALSLILAIAALHAQAKEDPSHRKAIIEQHKAIAAAHAAAAACLTAGKDEDACHVELAKACKGLAIGKQCGMRHKH